MDINEVKEILSDQMQKLSNESHDTSTTPEQLVALTHALVETATFYVELQNNADGDEITKAIQDGLQAIADSYQRGLDHERV